MTRLSMWVVIPVVLLVLGCSAAPEVRRTEITETVDLSGRWNDTDARLVADEMIADCLSRPWLGRFRETHGGKPPVVIVGDILNRSHEHINTQVFEKNLERALINSGEVDFVASKDERRALRQEKADMQSGFTSAETAKSLSGETGADFMLHGTVNSIKDEIKGEYVIFYQVNMELTELESNRKSWIGEKQIKKVVSRSRFTF